MTQRTSLVGGIVSFTAVIILSWVSQNLDERGGYFQRMLLPVIEESIDFLEDTDTLDVRGAPPPLSPS
jgi:hypothetical protein